MKCLSRQDIEAIAARVVNAYIRLPELQGKPLYRIEPERLLQNVLGLNIDYHHLSMDNSVLGLTSVTALGVEVYENDDTPIIYYLDGKTVLIEDDLRTDTTQHGRCNFTIAHEGSHQIFKMLYPREYGGNAQSPKVHFYRVNSEKNKPISDWEEWQANALASAILLPKDLVMQGMYLFSLGEKIKMLNKVYAPRVYEQFKGLAEFLGVSKTALAIRMKQFGLIEQDYLDNPYRLTDVLCDGGV